MGVGAPPEVVYFGNDLNIVRKTGSTATEHRAAGPSTRHVDRAVRDQMAAIVTRWITDPARYTKVAETLAGIVSRYADQHRPDGWRVIADQWL